MTTKGRFAVVAMIDLAMRSANGPVNLSAISARRGISLSYLEQLFSKLRRQGLVRSVRGPGGGYFLALPAESISAADIVCAVDDASVVREDDLRPGFNGDRGQCDTSGLWSEVSAHMIELMGAISLSSLVAQDPAGATAADMNPRRPGISAEPVVKPIRTTAPNSVFALAGKSADRSASSGLLARNGMRLGSRR